LKSQRLFQEDPVPPQEQKESCEEVAEASESQFGPLAGNIEGVSELDIFYSQRAKLIYLDNNN
jgi:hypothetical protein